MMVAVVKPAAATETTPATPTNTEIKLPKWSFALNVGLTINTGNTRSRVLNGGLKVDLRLKIFSFSTSFESFYGSYKGEVLENKGKWMNTATAKISDRFNLYGKVVMEYDRLAEITLQSTLGLGLQYVVYTSPQTKVMFGGTVNGEFTDIFKVLENIEALGLGMDLAFEHNMTNNSKIAFDTAFHSNFKEFMKDYRVEANLSVAVLMVKPLWIKVKLRDKYMNIPVFKDLSRNDFSLITALEFSF